MPPEGASIFLLVLLHHPGASVFLLVLLLHPFVTVFFKAMSKYTENSHQGLTLGGVSSCRLCKIS
ncbi:Ras and Rab interactor 2 (predicted), isoform CRA_e [Rattus norvegicus]|uniref:Ras and Rab interactor 2 (Predicted), isoform CRA_e n=1 Tax=Rattus norvegicus TaxID=10116 RepID=A6K772_RAT|nr:Ras and Rab interactor 2 (predicted), isoform CRA_e [Rattus norvegicus]